jgi:hypothetical protein
MNGPFSNNLSLLGRTARSMRMPPRWRAWASEGTRNCVTERHRRPWSGVRYPPLRAVWGSRSSGQVPVQMGVLRVVARRRCRRSDRWAVPGAWWRSAFFPRPVPGPCGLAWCDDRQHGVRCRIGRCCRWRRWSWCGRYRFPSQAVRAARGAGPRGRGIGPAGQREDGPAAILDQPGGQRPQARLLLRTSVLERVNGELADLMTGGSGGERALQDLEEANAFFVALDAARSRFRYGADPGRGTADRCGPDHPRDRG